MTRSFLAAPAAGIVVFFLTHASVLIQATLHAVSVDDFRGLVILYLFLFSFALSAAATLNLYLEYKLRRKACRGCKLRKLMAKFQFIRWQIPSSIAFLIFALGVNFLTSCPYLSLVAVFTYIHMAYLVLGAVGMAVLSVYLKPSSSQS